MRICIFTIGTQGDARPFVALGRRLQSLGHSVRIITSDKHRALVERAGLELAPIRSDFAELMAQEHAAMDRGNNLRIGRQMARALGAWMPVWAQEGMEATQGADLILGSGSGTILGGSIAEKRGVPFVQAQFLPLTPSRFIPPLWPSPGRVRPGFVNLAISWSVRLLMWRLLARSTRILRDELGLAPFPWRGPWFSTQERALHRPILYAFSRHLQPRPADWPAERADVVGFWFYDEASSWTPPADLAAFLADGPPPIYVGFGSMISGRPQALTRVVLDAIHKSGRRALVATGWGGLQSTDMAPPPGVFFIDQAPHDWLFPRVSMAVHHGGAGTTAAAARAGLPQIIVPFVADQFFWAWKLKTLKINPVLLDRTAMTSDDLAAAIRAAGDDAFAARTAALKTLIDQEDGVGSAIAALERWGFLIPEPPGQGATLDRPLPVETMMAAGHD